MIRIAIVATAMAAAMPQIANPIAPAAAPPLSQSEAAHLTSVGAMGKKLHDYDQAGWAATDVFLSRIPRERIPKRGGWVVEPRADEALTVTFYELTDDASKVVFVAATKKAKIVESRVVRDDEGLALTSAQLRMARALEAASVRFYDGKHPRCTPGGSNPVVVTPDNADGAVSVYFLSPQVQSGVYPAGGHYKIDVDNDGRILSDRAFTNGCLNLGEPKKSQRKPVAYFLTHILDQTPTEIHAFISLWSGVPVVVSTSDRRFWNVDGATISLMPDAPPS